MSRHYNSSSSSDDNDDDSDELHMLYTSHKGTAGWRKRIVRRCALIPLAALMVVFAFWHLLLFAVMYNQRRFLYHSYYPPLSRSQVTSPSQAGYSGPYRTVWIDCPDGVRLHAFHLLYPTAAAAAAAAVTTKTNTTTVASAHAPTLLWFHGTAGNIGHRLEQAVRLHRACRCNIFLLSYRGYGLSSGEPTFRGIQLDTQTGLDWLGQHGGRGGVVLFGQSLGGAIALDLLARNRGTIAGCIIENTFTDLGSLFSHLFAPLRYVAHMISDPWDNVLSLRSVGEWMPPMLFLSGRKDELIPARMMDVLHEEAKRRARPGIPIVKKDFADGKHIYLNEMEGYYEAFEDFFDGLRKLQ